MREGKSRAIIDNLSQIAEDIATISGIDIEEARRQRVTWYMAVPNGPSSNSVSIELEDGQLHTHQPNQEITPEPRGINQADIDQLGSIWNAVLLLASVGEHPDTTIYRYMADSLGGLARIAPNHEDINKDPEVRKDVVKSVRLLGTYAVDLAEKYGGPQYLQANAEATERLTPLLIRWSHRRQVRKHLRT